MLLPGHPSKGDEQYCYLDRISESIKLCERRKQLSSTRHSRTTITTNIFLKLEVDSKPAGEGLHPGTHVYACKPQTWRFYASAYPTDGSGGIMLLGFLSIYMHVCTRMEIFPDWLDWPERWTTRKHNTLPQLQDKCRQNNLRISGVVFSDNRSNSFSV